MTSLADKTTKELEEEIRRRKEAASMAPEKLPEESQDWSPVITMVSEYMKKRLAREWIDDDLEGYLFEAAVQCVYGDRIWEYLNQFFR